MADFKVLFTSTEGVQFKKTISCDKDAKDEQVNAYAGVLTSEGHLVASCHLYEEWPAELENVAEHGA